MLVRRGFGRYLRRVLLRTILDLFLGLFGLGLDFGRDLDFLATDTQDGKELVLQLDDAIDKLLHATDHKPDGFVGLE